jgi:hypothetical protein
MLELTNSDVPYELPPPQILIFGSPEKGLGPLKAKYGIVRHNVKATVTLEKHPSDKISFTVGTYFNVF